MPIVVSPLAAARMPALPERVYWLTFLFMAARNLKPSSSPINCRIVETVLKAVPDVPGFAIWISFL